MARTIKVQALEIDGEELRYPEEVLLSVDNIVGNNYGKNDLAEILEHVRNNPVVTSMDAVGIKREINYNISVNSNITILARNPVIASGVVIDIDASGEVIVI